MIVRVAASPALYEVAPNATVIVEITAFATLMLAVAEIVAVESLTVIVAAPEATPVTGT